MKPGLVIHLKAKSQRLKNKNFRKLLNKPLFKITFDKISKFRDEFDIYIDSSSSIFKKEAKKYNFNFIRRPVKLNKPNAQGNELLFNCLKRIDNELIYVLHVTNPFAKISTIKNCIKILRKNKRINSVTPVKPIYDRYWFNKKEVNHKYNKLIGSQFLKPVFVEAGSYCFRRKNFLSEKSRVSKKNLFYDVDNVEAIDIDNEFDFFLAENLAKKLRIKFD